MLRLISFHFTFLYSFLEWNWKMLIRKIPEIIYIFRFIAVMQLIKFDFESIFNKKSINKINIFDKERNGVRFEYVLCKNFWFCLNFIVWAQFSHKTDKFWFWKSLKYFNIFNEKRYGVKFEYVPWKKCLILFCFYCLGSL